MLFKRSEGFRYAFGEPVQATFKILENDEALNKEVSICEILDISPKGIKMYTRVDLHAGRAICPPLEIRFILDTKIIEVRGEVMWSKPYIKGKQYGIFFNNQPLQEELIVDELKIRRKKEIQIEKQRKK